MTLILGMSKAEGIYMSVDYRVTRRGRLVDDASVKFLSIHHPPEGGPRSILAYTGIAEMPDGTRTGDWIRETLRGEMGESFGQSMAHLMSRLDRDVMPLGRPLIINLLVIRGQRRWIAGLSNVRKNFDLRDSFAQMVRELQEPCIFANGSGALIVANRHLHLLRRQLRVRPREHFDHMKLLATVNRRVAAEDGSVSPFCHVSYLPQAPGGPSPGSFVFREKGESVPFKMPVLVDGVDLSFLAEEFMEQFRRKADRLEFDKDEANKHLKRRP